jgi:hypothetical protein
MTVALFVPWGLAALSSTPGTPPPATPPPAEELMRTAIHDIAPPVDVFPYPPWMVATAISVVVLLLALLVWLLVKWMRRRPGPPPLSATAIALQELERLRAEAGETEPYEFSITVSEVLRRFIGNAKFRLPATRQTSPEFLAAISGSELFSEADRSLLGRFLEKCDMIKFARIHATSADNSELVESALAFVQGGRS